MFQKILLVLAATTIALAVSANEEDGQSSAEQQCQEWAVMDQISQEDMAGYMKECIHNLEGEAEQAEAEQDAEG